jgi:hypothetical protein
MSGMLDDNLNELLQVLGKLKTLGSTEDSKLVMK